VSAPFPVEHPNGKEWHNQSAADVLAHFGSSNAGLSLHEASQRLIAEGPNAIKEGKHISLLKILLIRLSRN
jgi:hypothetical protein